MDPADSPWRSFSITQPRKFPGMLHSVPKIEDFAAVHKNRGSVPDPLRSVTHDDHHRVGGIQPTQFPKLRVQSAEDVVGVSQATDQKPAHQRMAPWRGLHPFAG